MLQVVADLLFLKRISHLSCLAKKVKVPAHGALVRIEATAATAERVVVEGILFVVELVAQAIIRILEIDPI